MNARLKLLVEMLIAASLGLMVVSCGDKGEKKPSGEAATAELEMAVGDDFFDDWKTYTYQNIRIVYPEDHPQGGFLENMAKGYVAAMARDCQFLGIEIPAETLTVYFYTGYGQGMSSTNQEYPFAIPDKAVIHFWLPSFLGPTLMEYLLPRWQAGEPQFRFLKHGIIALLDYSGQNYHARTQGFAVDTGFIPLADLAVDTSVNVNEERHQTAEAASFVDFVVYYYGIDALKGLYTAEDSFEAAVDRVFKLPVADLEDLWLGFVDMAAEMDTVDMSKANRPQGGQ